MYVPGVTLTLALRRSVAMTSTWVDILVFGLRDKVQSVL